MTYKDRYKTDHASVKEIASAFDKGEYFKVILLAPQVFGILLDSIAKDYSEDLAQKIDIVEDKDTIEIYSMYNRLLQSESIKARLAGALLAFYEADYWGNKEPAKQFKKYFTKIEGIFSLRNTLAHEYFLGKISASNMRRKAKECFDVIDLLNEFWCLY